MLFRVKIIQPGDYRIQWCNWWWPFWKDEGAQFSNLRHARFYVWELKMANKGSVWR